MPDQPNILFLFTDDQRFDTIAALGNPHIHTPCMDQLVARGTACTHAHIMGGSVPAVCMPSRAMLHTGRHLFDLQDSGSSIPDDHILLGEHLQRAGYRSCGIGKWHNGKEAFARSFNCGGPIFFGGMYDHWNVPCYDYDPSGTYADEHRSHRSGSHSSQLLADGAIDFLRSHQDAEQPFFCYVSFLAPHDPRTMPAWFRELYRQNPPPLPANYLPEHPFDNGELLIRDEKLAAFPRTPAEVIDQQADYYAMITHLDFEIGRIIEQLKTSGQYDNTIIVLAGDNGLGVGRHGLFGKQNMYDHSLRVPLVLAGPGIAQGERRDGLCYLHDINPTLLQLAGIEPSADLPTKSLLPMLQDGSQGHRQELHAAYRGVQRAVVCGRFKLIEYAVDGHHRRQLFDLEQDPDELHDLSELESQQQRLADMAQSLECWRDSYGDRLPELGQRFWATARP